MTPARARALVRMARRLGELPETRAALEAGELCEEQVAVVCRHVPTTVDGEAANLIVLCNRHHRLHHLGRLGISGDADDPDGMVFTDERGRRLENRSRPDPPGQPVELVGRRLDIPTGAWSHPSGERFDPQWVHFSEPAC